MSDGFHPPVEEYLETVLSLKEEGTPAIQARIAERLGKSAPSVSEMLDRLSDDGYVRRDGRVVNLTAKGSELAEKVVRRHRLAERLLVDIIGLEWHKVHLEAGRWEHVISDDVEARLIALLGDPSTCPHGNPIPGSSNAGSQTPASPLSQTPAGATVRLERISEEVELDMVSLEFLDQHGFIPGASAHLDRRDEAGVATLNTTGVPFAISAQLSERLFVSVS